MPLPASYTEETLAELMHSELGNTAILLGLSVGAADPGSYQEAVNDTLVYYGVSLITEVTDLQKLRSVAKWRAWVLANNEAAALYTLNTDGTNRALSDVPKNTQLRLAQALAEAQPYLPGGGLTFHSLRYTDDPYTNSPDGEPEF